MCLQEIIEKLQASLGLDASASVSGRSDSARHRNIAIVLGCIAEKLAGPRSLEFFSEDIMEYLLANMVRI